MKPPSRICGNKTHFEPIVEKSKNISWFFLEYVNFHVNFSHHEIPPCEIVPLKKLWNKTNRK